MGRKSSTKKIVRELVKEKQKREKEKGLLKKKKSKQELKEEASKAAKKKHKKNVKKKSSTKSKFNLPTLDLSNFKFEKPQIYGALLTLIMVTLLITVGFLVFKQAFRPTPIAKYLPANQTVFFLELNSNLEHQQLIRSFEILEKYPNYSLEALTEIFEKQFVVNFETEIQPWLGRNSGLALLHSQEHDNQINHLYFAETSDSTKAEIFLQERAAVKPHASHKIYLLPEGREALILDNYLFLSPSEDALAELIDHHQSDSPTLYNSKPYRRTANNLPFNNIAFAFINFQRINQSFLEAFPALTDNELSFELIQPMLNLFQAEGFALVALEDKFALQSFLSLSRDKVQDANYINHHERYRAELTRFVADDALIFWGGKNLEYQMKRLIEALAVGDQQAMEVFDSVMQNYVNRFFGPEITLSNDILPLFESEFALVAEEINDRIVFKLLLIADEDDSLNTLHDIFNNFAKVGAVYQQKVVSHTLADGTVAQEIVAVPENIKRSKSRYNSTDIHQIIVGRQQAGIYYTVYDEIAIISDNLQGLHNTIDLIAEGGKTLHANPAYNELIYPILSNSDEITYLNFEGLLPLLFPNQVPEDLLPLSALSSGKNYFTDGISTINYLDVK